MWLRRMKRALGELPSEAKYGVVNSETY